MRELCLLYLARAANGPAPVREFLDSYSRFAAGAEHDFAIIFKGFRSEADTAQYRELAGKVCSQFLFVNDSGFDIKAYGIAARKLHHPFYCFLNSFSEILVANWLGSLLSAAKQPGVGLAGATGSGESMYTNVLIQRQQWKNPRLLNRLWTPLRLILCRLCFDPFPNYHIRTNAILISRDVFSRVWPGRVLAKRAAYLFENGKNGLTNRVRRMGLHPLVVGKEGWYEERDRARSRTFRSGNQENLLVADNQTRQFQSADLETRKYLAMVAWGEQAIL